MHFEGYWKKSDRQSHGKLNNINADIKKLKLELAVDLESLKANRSPSDVSKKIEEIGHSEERENASQVRLCCQFERSAFD